MRVGIHFQIRTWRHNLLVLKPHSYCNHTFKAVVLVYQLGTNSVIQQTFV